VPRSTLQIQRDQLRALLLLLTVLPLLPTGVMARFMIDSVLEERGRFSQELDSALVRNSPALAARFREEFTTLPPWPAAAPTLHPLAERLREELGRENAVRIVEAHPYNRERAYAGPRATGGAVWYQLDVGSPHWRVEWARPIPGFFSEEFRDQTWQMILVAGGTFGLVCSIAYIAGREVTRRMELAELRTDRLSQIAHELRTPVASMRAIADTLRDTRVAEYPGARQEYYGMLDRESRRLALVTEMFLWHSRLENPGTLRLRREPVTLGPVLEECAGEFRELVRSLKGRMEVQVRQEATVLGDPEALRMILRNLLDNAVKYRGPRPPDIEVRLENYAEEARITVRDRGIGIPPEQHRRVFESRVQLDDRLSQNVPGSGLGLSIVAGLVRAQEGLVELESAAGRGATFLIRLPLLD
jgi:signal transduction histidine kinase